MSAGVPVTIITGFLGSGKTTLLKYIMSENHGYKIAIVQNEFSDEMGIESPTLVDSNGELVKDIFELPNGCICCSVRDDMVAAIDNLLDRYPGKFDYILVETTGVSDPEPIAASFWVDEGLGSNVRLDGIVTLVDAKNFEAAIGLKPLTDAVDLDQTILQNLENENMKNHAMETEEQSLTGLLGLAKEAMKQVAAADCILLNKKDLVDEETLNRVRHLLFEINPLAELVETDRSVVDLSAVLGLNAFEPTKMTSRLTNALSTIMNGDLHVGHPKDNEHSHDCKECKLNPVSLVNLNENFSSTGHAHGGVSNCLVTVRLELGRTAIDAELLEPLLGDLIWGRNAGIIYRCKGLFYGLVFDDDDEGRMWKKTAVCVLQGVGESFEIVEVKTISPSDLIQEGEVDKNTIIAKFLFVGVGLKKEIILEGLKSVLKNVPGGKNCQIPDRKRFDDEE